MYKYVGRTKGASDRYIVFLHQPDVADLNLKPPLLILSFLRLLKIVIFLLHFVGVIARHPSYVPFISAALTEESVEKYFKHLFPSPPEEGRCRVKR